eukprot:gnl/TRDRNA2_/TRDRNA2_49445_c1_seq1.p1 gnl/TRDRNA2_/TRDRNA2_49445_c1~~gnl/TRDRNA2_/TRDRNA2_49445_c1_seq1.p1  ORF type:complete len:386 (+),score=59.58 gnl/TRDRNA2_/TRDRNA2_49445_c1_seq1:77-1159(+)
MVDSHGFGLAYVLPLVDSAVGLAEILNSRLRYRTNDPRTSKLRCDKFEQQEALLRAGLPTPAQCVTSDVECAISFAAVREHAVVKPRNSSGGDGVWLCESESDVRAAFQAELGRTNVEGGANAELVVMEYLAGEEWVVNTVSCSSCHKVTDVWRGPCKGHYGESGPKKFVYDVQHLVTDVGEHMFAIVEFTFSVLDAIGLCNGAAHTELVWAGRPYVLEVNPRCAGGMPRVPYRPNQLEVLAMSLQDPHGFEDLPQLPDTGETGAAAVFLRSPLDGWISSGALGELAALRTFARFDKGLFGVHAPYEAHRVHKTTGYFSSPGAVVLQGDPAKVLEDVELVRKIEAHAYVCELTTVGPGSA